MGQELSKNDSSSHDECSPRVKSLVAEAGEIENTLPSSVSFSLSHSHFGERIDNSEKENDSDMVNANFPIISNDNFDQFKSSTSTSASKATSTYNTSGGSTRKSTSSSLPKPFTNSDDWNARFLLGNLENLPASARKLFSMGKLYLTGGDRSIEREIGYNNLFQSLNSSHTGQASESNHSEHDCTDEEAFVPKTLLNHVKKVTNLFVPMQNSAPLNCAQTYVQWRAAHDLFNMYSFCTPTRNIIYLQPIDGFPQFIMSFLLSTNSMRLNFFEMLQGFVQIFFSGMEVTIKPPIFINDEEWNVRSRLHETTNQEQYCVTDLYPCLQKILPRDGRCIVGISWTDLFPEGFNFVLGETSNIHKAAAICFGRFETTKYNAQTHCDITKIDGPLVWKLLRTISHEICHVFGLIHCSFFLCAMNESSSVSDALSQPLFLCPVCLRKLQRVCGFDILDRYRLLHKFLSSLDHQFDNCQQLKESISWLDTCIEYLTISIN